MVDVEAIKRAAGGADRIVVLDTETTGVFTSDRVVEIALVTLSLDGQVIDAFETLVHPERDISATHIHGISASMVSSAPTFAEVAGDIAVRLHGACIAAHNLPFDARMVAGEFERLGMDLEITSGLDTLQATGARLWVACERFGVPLNGAHRALNDALATASLLSLVAAGCEPGCPVVAPLGLLRTRRVMRREDVEPVQLRDPSLITYLAARLAHPGVEAAALTYLELVGRAVSDLHLDLDERRQLNMLADDLGLTEPQVRQAHRRFVNELVDAALDDHIVSADEYSTLIQIGAALDVDQSLIERRTRDARSTTVAAMLNPGFSVVFTGDHPTLDRDTLVEHAREIGLQVMSGVTKRTDLLVAADASSSSGKAEKARRYGIPVIEAAAFVSAKAGDQLGGSGSSLETSKVITCPDCFAVWTVPATSSEQTRKRCLDCKRIRAVRSDGSARSRAAPILTIEQLSCRTCGTTWARARARGPKPTRCPNCLNADDSR